MTVSLTERQLLLLRMVAANCTDNRFFVPCHNRQEYFTDSLGTEDVFLSGSGDAAILRTFAKRGWTNAKQIAQYAYEITELGREVLMPYLKENQQ